MQGWLTGTLEVTSPYPGQVVAVQGEQIKVTCVIINPEKDTTHDSVTKILFYKILNRFGAKALINLKSGKFSYEHKTDCEYLVV